MKTIETDTPILPYVLADQVAGEYPGPLRRELADHLAIRANAVYAHSKQWAKAIRASGGRDTLYAFMEHWAKAWWQRTGKYL